MEPDFKEYEEYLTEIQNYRKNILDDIINKYTNNGNQDFLIDVTTLKVISYKDAEPRIPSYSTLTSYFCEPDAEPRIPSYSTLTSYFCEPARKLIKELSSRQKKDKDTSQREDKDTSQREDKDTSQREDKYTSQKEPLEWGKDSGIGSDTSSTAESSQESFTSSDEESGKYLIPQTIQKASLSIDIQQFSFRRQDSKVYEDLDSSLKIPICDLLIGKKDSKMFEKDLDSSLKKSKRDISCGRYVFKKDFDCSLKKSKQEFSFRRQDSKVSEDLDSSLKIPICDLSIGKKDSKMFEKDLDSSLKKSKRDLSFGRNVFEKDFDSSLKKSKWGNRKPNIIPVRRNPAFKQDTSFLRNIPLNDGLFIARSVSKSSNNINCSSKM